MQSRTVSPVQPLLQSRVPFLNTTGRVWRRCYAPNVPALLLWCCPLSPQATGWDRRGDLEQGAVDYALTLTCTCSDMSTAGTCLALASLFRYTYWVLPPWCVCSEVHDVPRGAALPRWWCADTCASTLHSLPLSTVLEPPVTISAAHTVWPCPALHPAAIFPRIW